MKSEWADGGNEVILYAIAVWVVLRNLQQQTWSGAEVRLLELASSATLAGWHLQQSARISAGHLLCKASLRAFNHA